MLTVPPVYAVRQMRVDDADELGRIHTDVWRTTYAGLMPADFLAGLSAEGSAQRWREMLTDPAAGT